MLNFFQTLLAKLALPGGVTNFLAHLLFVMAIIGICFISELFFRFIVLRSFYKISKRSSKKLFTFIQENKLLEQAAHLISPLIINVFIPSFPTFAPLLFNLNLIYLVIVLIRILSALMNVFENIYQTHEISAKRPIKAVLQVFKIVIIIILSTIVISSWLGESPLVLLSGIGAFTAILSLVFKDAILGFMAGIQLTNNDMVRIGDWIEIPSSNVNGVVKEITLIAVQVQNFDNTVTSVPAYTLISAPFRNWREMIESQSRRMMRAVFIDISSIGFCSPDLLYRYDYLAALNKSGLEGTSDNQTSLDLEAELSDRLTNIGLFRLYLEDYLRKHSKVRHDMSILVRQLPSTAQGVPLEVCAFINETTWVPFENAQSDIFEHIFATAPAFGLTIFQLPSGNDLQSSKNSLLSAPKNPAKELQEKN